MMANSPNTRAAFKPDNLEELPPLPGIHAEAIRIQIFTHRSYYARPNHVFEDQPNDPSPDNEKYEHLGDTVLGLVVTDLLLEMYPNLRVGPSTKIRALIVGNATLAEFSRRYRLPEHLLLHPAQAITLRASMHIQADVFESYVGGLYLDQGLDAVKAWLKPLFGPYTTRAYHKIRMQHGLPPVPSPPSPVSAASSPSSTSSPYPPCATCAPTTQGHLALFNQQVQKDNKEVEWVYDRANGEGAKTTPIWIVKVKVNGEILGHGQGGTKKAARNEAAKQGLEKMGIDV